MSGWAAMGETAAADLGTQNESRNSDQAQTVQSAAGSLEPTYMGSIDAWQAIAADVSFSKLLALTSKSPTSFMAAH